MIGRKKLAGLSTREFDSHVKVGQVLSNKKLAVTFDVSTHGGMRRSLKNDCLVITPSGSPPVEHNAH
jgi:hypothetical protein